MTRACLLLLALLATPAWADQKSDAKAHIAAGTKLYNVQQYDKAAAEYQAAYLLDPKPEYLYAIAQAQRLGGDCDKAIKSYEAYIRAKPPEGQREKAQKNIDRCHEDIQSRASMNDLPPPEEIPPLPPMPLEPLEDETKPPPSIPPPPPPPPGKSYVIGHLLVGGGVAVGAAGTLLFLHGKSAINDINAAPTYDAFAMKKSGLDSAKSQQTYGVLLISAGGAMIVGGIVYYALHSAAPDEQATMVAPAPAPGGGATLTISGSF